MATYFDLSKTSGSGNGSFTVTPKAGYTGRGPVSNTITISTTGGKKATVSSSKHFPLTRTAEAVSTSTSLTGTYTAATVTNNQLSVSNSATTFVKVATTINAKSIAVSGAPSNVYVKVGTQWLQTDGSLGSNSVNIGNNRITITSDPGKAATYAAEVILQIPANASGSAKTYSLGLIYGGTNYPTTDSDKFSYSLLISQGAGTITYGNVTISSFKYDAVTATLDVDPIPASGGTTYPVVTYSQTYGYNGSTTGGGTITTGATLSYKKNSGSATLNTNNGQVTATSKGTTASAQGSVANVTITVTLNGKSATATADAIQGANTAGAAQYSAWTATLSASPTTVSASGGTSTISSSCTRTQTIPYTSGANATSTQTATATYAITGSATISGSTVTFGENQTTSARSATVTATYKYNDTAVTPSSTGAGKTTVVVNQSAGTKAYGNITATLSYPTATAAGGTLNPTVSWSQPWGWNGSTSNGGTLTGTTANSYSGTSGLSINTSTGAVTVAGLGTTVKAATELGTVTATITQNGKTANPTAKINQAENKIASYNYGGWNINLSANPTSIGASGGTSTITTSATRSKTPVYSSGSTGTASTETSSTAPTLSVSGTGFTLSGTTVTVAANGTVSSRSGVVTATFTGATNKTVTITQVAGASTLTVNPTTLGWSATETGAKTITITSNDSWTITIA